MIIFERKTMPKEKFPPDVVTHLHPKGWVDMEGRLWNYKEGTRRPGWLYGMCSELIYMTM